ncbi:MAG: spermidine/putrescine ABC transporter substrate-binding protein [Treponema sp.]|jgi:spermidine/putrescine-binding protein|nr:spermidine/putrescine ABC transporter substrate-binding protein [Treponema sp.]
MKKGIRIIAVLLFVLLLAGCGNKNRLTIYTWDEMFPQDVLRSFEKETGIKINYINFDENETMLARLQAARAGNYDLIIADDYIIEMAIAEGLVQKLDKSKISNFRNINPIYQRQFYDPADEYTVPYGAGVQTIVYDPKRVNIEIFGYYDLWDSSFINSLGIIGNFRVINGMALKVLGESYNTNNTGKIRDAGELLLQLAPNIRLIMDDRLEDQLLSGEISAAVMYTSQVTAAKMANPNLEVVFPEEGIGFGIMAGFIPAKAPNPDAAHAFLNFILNAQTGASCFEHLGYYSTNSASDPLIAPKYRDFLTLPSGFNVNMEMIKNISPEADEAHNIIWTSFRNAAGGR